MATHETKEPPDAAVLAALGLALLIYSTNHHAQHPLPAPAAPAAPSTSTSASTSAQPTWHPVPLPPLTGDAKGELPLAAFPAARVEAPIGAAVARPALIVLHADGETAEAACSAWRRVSAWPFVLCPGGTPAVPGGNDDLPAAGSEPELRAGLAALKARYREHLAAGAVILAGHREGAARALVVARSSPSFFARLVLVQPDAARWSTPLASLLASRGMDRVLFACSSPTCAEAIEPLSVRTRGVHIESRLIEVGEPGQGVTPALEQELKKEWPWLVSGDPRFQP